MTGTTPDEQLDAAALDDFVRWLAELLAEESQPTPDEEIEDEHDHHTRV